MKTNDDNESPSDIRRRSRSRALRAAKVATLAFALGGCYGAHDRPHPTDAGRDPVDDASIVMADAGPLRRDAGPGEDCEPDPDCTSGGGDGACDWDQFNACCDELDWEIEPCWLPGGPMRPPEMPA